MDRQPPRAFTITFKNRLARFIWGIVWALLFRPSPRLAHGWRRALLRTFGATIGRGAHVYPSAEVWAPWNLVMGEHACLGPHVDCYCMAKVELGAHATVSQYTHLCAGTHDIERPGMQLMSAPITIGAGAWVAAGAFVGPGVTIGARAVIGARSTVVSDVPAGVVAAGCPAKILRRREAMETTTVSAQRHPDDPSLPIEAKAALTAYGALLLIVVGVIGWIIYF